MGKAKVTSKEAHTILQLELFAAVLAAEMAELISQELNLDVQTCKVLHRQQYYPGLH